MATETSMPRALMNTEPTMALSRPPGVPAAGVDSTKVFRLRPPSPLTSRDQRMAVRATIAINAATQQKPVKAMLAALRRV